MFSFFIIILSVRFTNQISIDPAPFVQTKLGGISGFYKKSFSGRNYEAYEGIPYALPPTRERRFEVNNLDKSAK